MVSSSKPMSTWLKLMASIVTLANANWAPIGGITFLLRCHITAATDVCVYSMTPLDVQDNSSSMWHENMFGVIFFLPLDSITRRLLWNCFSENCPQTFSWNFTYFAYWKLVAWLILSSFSAVSSRFHDFSECHLHPFPQFCYTLGFFIL